MKKIIIENQKDADNYIVQLQQSMHTTIEKIRMSQDEPCDLFYNLKFKAVGKDPLEDRDLNFIEQLNQTYTYLVSFFAIKYLYENTNYYGKFMLNLGTTSGSDIESIDGEIIAEVFAATSVLSNQKIIKDIEKLKKVEHAKQKFVFYHTPIDETNKVSKIAEKHKEIKIVKLNFNFT